MRAKNGMKALHESPQPFRDTASGENFSATLGLSERLSAEQAGRIYSAPAVGGLMSALRLAFCVAFRRRPRPTSANCRFEMRQGSGEIALARKFPGGASFRA